MSELFQNQLFESWQYYTDSGIEYCHVLTYV